MSIFVPERGNTEISAAQFERLQASSEFWVLIDRGVLGAVLRPTGAAQLTAGPYVGRAVCGDQIVEIVEKIPGALSSLLGYASGAAFRLESPPGARTEIGPLIRLLVSAFLTEARRYLSQGREFRYSRRRDCGPMVAGAIQVPATAQMRARGLRHQIVFDRTVVTHETEKNIVVSRALREVEHIASAVGIDASDVTQARALGMYFDEYQSSRARARLELGRVAEKLASAGRLDTTLLALAALLLRHESFEHADWLGDTTPRTWFVNLERLFEDALLQQINRVNFAGLTARRGSSFGRSIYAPPEHERADPDIVLMQNSDIVGVGDAKYKNWSGSPARSDVYQLLVHGSAFGSPVCFLAYASDTYQSVFLGQSVTGAAVHVYALDVTNLEHSVAAMLDDLDSPVLV